MDRQSLTALAEFCAEQHEAFSASAWTSRCGIDAMRLAGAAEYLSMTSWYGHAEALASVASKIRASRRGGSDVEAADDIELADFSAMTRYLLALRRIELARNVDNGSPNAGSRK